MVRKLFILLVLVGLAAVLFNLFAAFRGNDSPNPVARHYIEKGAQELGTANLVTAVVVTYRGLDTLGEVSILFLSASILGFFLKIRYDQDPLKSEIPRKASEILETGATLLVPLVFLLGAYIFINGHLTPGGGFPGGAVIASGVLLTVMANPLKKFSHNLISAVESLSGFFFVLVGVLGIILAGGFLDNRIFGTGTLGSIFSAGAIPIIYIFIGMKVGAELSNILVHMKDSRTGEA